MLKLGDARKDSDRHVDIHITLPYEVETIKKIALPDLEFRRFRGDMIELYKIAHNKYDRTSIDSLFHFVQNSRLRGHSFKVAKFACRKRQYQHFFTNRSVNHWNKLSHNTVQSTSLNAFKNNIDKTFSHLMYKTNIFKT